MKRQNRWRRFFMAFICFTGLTSVSSAQIPGYTTIDFPGATSTSAWGINSRGDVVGVYSLPDKTTHGFLWSGGRLTSIDIPGADSTDTWGINSQGDIVGDYTVKGVLH